MKRNNPIETNHGDNQQRHDNTSLLGDLTAANRSSASTLDISNWQPSNFHTFANCLDLYNCLPNQYKDAYKQSLKKNYARWVQNICSKTLKKKPVRDVFEMFSSSANENPNDLRQRMFSMFSKYGYSDINNDAMTDEFMISIINCWYPFTDKETCSWFSASNLESICKSWSSNELNGRVCYACATHFINMIRNGAMPDLFGDQF